MINLSPTQKFFEKLDHSETIKIICWDVMHGKLDDLTIALAHWLLETDLYKPGDPTYDLLSCLTNFSGDLKDIQDIDALHQTIRPIVEEIIT